MYFFYNTCKKAGYKFPSSIQKRAQLNYLTTPLWLNNARFAFIPSVTVFGSWNDSSKRGKNQCRGSSDTICYSMHSSYFSKLIHTSLTEQLVSHQFSQRFGCVMLAVALSCAPHSEDKEQDFNVWEVVFFLTQPPILL